MKSLEKQSAPNENTQQNLGNLAYYYTDKLYTHLEKLTQHRRISEAKILMQEYKDGMEGHITDAPDASEVAKISAYYFKKLTNVIQSLLDADRIGEAQNLQPFLHKIDARRKTFEINLQRMAKSLPRKF
jgi:hypothetical protein